MSKFWESLVNAKRNDVQHEVREVITHLQRLEDKIDRFIENNRG